MSVLDEPNRTAATAHPDPPAAWDEGLPLEMRGRSKLPAIRCHWVRDPLGAGMISIWAPDPPDAEAP